MVKTMPIFKCFREKLLALLSIHFWPRLFLKHAKVSHRSSFLSSLAWKGGSIKPINSTFLVVDPAQGGFNGTLGTTLNPPLGFCFSNFSFELWLHHSTRSAKHPHHVINIILKLWGHHCYCTNVGVGREGDCPLLGTKTEVFCTLHWSNLNDLNSTPIW